jgi:hypothetical protein
LAEEPDAEAVTNPDDIVFRVTQSITRRIGSLIVACSRLEHTLEITIWALLKLDSEDGKMLTARMEMNRKQAILKELLQRNLQKGGEPIDPQFWEILQGVIEGRNKVAHGVWVTTKGRPAIASTKWRQYKDYMTLELFSYEKLVALESLAIEADKMLRAYADAIQLQHVGLVPPPPSSVTIHQANPPERQTETERQPPPQS